MNEIFLHSKDYLKENSKIFSQLFYFPVDKKKGRHKRKIKQSDKKNPTFVYRLSLLLETVLRVVFSSVLLPFFLLLFHRRNEK